MSDYPQKQSGKFVLSQNQNQHPPPPPSPLGGVGVIHQRRHHLSQQNSPLHRRRPLASANNNNNNNFNNLNGNVGPTPTPTAPTSAGSFHCYGEAETRTSNGNGDDNHDEDSLKTNVQIVLDNINRNYHALREQILNNQLNNNNNNGNNSVNLSQDTNHHSLALLQQRLQSVSNGHQFQQLRKGTGIKMAATSPADSDSNCNPYLPVSTAATAAVNATVPLSCSIASSQDFSHDYSDYQWFMDYGSYRDGITHQSILSALSASYNGIGELSYYEDLAKNIDANLAEVDMESFRTEDIHSLLTTNSAEFRHSRGIGGGGRNNNRGESITGGLMGTASRSGLELNLAGIGLGGGQHNGGMDSSEICKSELLFSPVKESHISVDSLDMDGYPDEDDIILTCQANKNNYTIAFEQSVMYSDESFYDGPENYGKQQHQYRQMLSNTQQMNFNNLDQLIRRKAEAMSTSEVGYTTWSKLRNNAVPGQRFPLVTAANPFINQISRHAPTCFVRKSLSMPDLKEKSSLANQQPTVQEPQHHQGEPGGSNGKHQINVSQVVPQQQHQHQHQSGNSCAASSESYGKQMRTLLPMPSDFGANNGSNGDGSHADSSCDNNEDDDPSHQPPNQNSAGQQHQPSFNLVKLFIKQKSSSSADTTCMDVSSGCWPSDSSSAGSGTGGGAPSNGSENNNNSNTNLAVASSKDALRSRKKSMNDSGKCSSTLGRHEEEEFQFDSLDPVQDDAVGGKLNDFNSPAHKRNYKAYNMNIAGKNQPAMNPAVYNLMNNNGGSGNSSSSSITNQQNNNNNNNNSFKDTNSDASRTSENLTQIFNVARSSGEKTRVPIEMITKSMQTSFIGGAAAKEKVRVVPPSFLDRLQKLGDKQKAPVFVVYPNYVLPDLGFLNSQQKDVVISPLSFKENFGAAKSTKKPRPVSMNDIENIKAKEYKHVMDWKSLVTLLPQEYRKLLRNIPEANAVAASEDPGQKPLFCMTPPLRRGRGVTCDCVNLLGQTQTYNSSSSGGSSSQPPSSGYRGSSTMLTDSEMDLLGPSATNFSNNMYVYQYDSPAEVSSAERPPSGRTPKSILRRAPTKAKRNSMFEENQRVHTAEKRRSLQEPCYNFSDEQLSILEEQPRKVNNSPNLSQHQPRLPNTPKLPSADDYHRLNKLNELNDFELKQAVTSKLTQRSHEDDLEARIRAEHFLSNVPKSELKHYAEIAHVLETTTAEGATAPSEEAYDRNRLRHEVSRALSQRKNVSFNSPSSKTTPQQLLRPTEIKFTTPPNSPNMSVVVGAQRPPTKPTTPTQTTPSNPSQAAAAAEREKQDKIQSNRFKRLQIQWELLSKEGQQLKQELQQQPRSGGNTPTGAMKSRIPRPVSYPTTRANSDPMVSKTLKSPSRIVPPSSSSAKKKFGSGSTGNVAAAPQPAPRTPSKLLHTTPKKTPAAAATTGPRPATRTRIPVGPSSLSNTASSPAVVSSSSSSTKTKPIIRKPITTPVRPTIGGKKSAAPVAAKV